MDRAYIDTHHLVDRYVQGKLSGETLDDFEIYMLEHPEINDEIEYAKGMQQALSDGKDNLFPDHPATASRPSGNFWLGRQHAMAATILLVVTTALSGLLYYQNWLLRTPQHIAEVVWFESERGSDLDSAADDLRVIEHTPGDAILFRIDPGFSRQGSYAVEIVGTDTAFTWSSSAIVTDFQRPIDITVKDLPFGNYHLFVTTGDGNEPPARFAFEVSPKSE